MSTILFFIHFFTIIMPESSDCTYDLLIKDYTEINLDRMTNENMVTMCRHHLTKYFESFNEHELIEHINDQEDEETANDLISSLYGMNPPDCFIVGRDEEDWVTASANSQTDYDRIPNRY